MEFELDIPISDRNQRIPQKHSLNEINRTTQSMIKDRFDIRISFRMITIHSIFIKIPPYSQNRSHIITIFPTCLKSSSVSIPHKLKENMECIRFSITLIQLTSHLYTERLIPCDDRICVKNFLHVGIILRYRLNDAIEHSNGFHETLFSS